MKQHIVKTLRLKSFFHVFLLLSMMLLSSCAKTEAALESNLTNIDSDIKQAIGDEDKLDNIDNNIKQGISKKEKNKSTT